MEHETSGDRGHTRPLPRGRLDGLRRGLARYASPVALALVLLGFGSGFLVVSCDTPGGYGRMQRGGTTSYSGVDLATGTAPRVDAEHLRPTTEREPDRLPPQPLIALSAAFVVAAGAAAVFLTVRRHRHLVTAALAASATGTLAAGVLHARTVLLDRVVAQSDEPLPRGKTYLDYVQLGGTFWLLLIVLVTVTAGHFTAALRDGRR